MEEKNLEKIIDKIAQEMSSYNEAIKKLVTKEEFKKLEQRTEKIEQRTERIEQRTERIEQRTERIEQRTEKIEQRTEKIEQRTEKIEQRTERLEKTTERLEKTTERLEKTTEKIAIIVGDHTEKIKNLVTREEFDKKMDRVLQGEDKILAILTHLERERIFTFDRIERMEEEINKIKKHLAMV